MTSNRVLLRIFSFGRETVSEFKGPELLARSLDLAERYCEAPPAGVVLLLLPHSVELFLLHIGLILRGRLPAILAWPTDRVDPEKYQRNLLHQLANLPAAELITLPQLARSLSPGIACRVTEFPIAGYKRLGRSFGAQLTIDPISKRISDRVAAGDAPEDALFLQFSGGTTGPQKCVVVTAPMLVKQLHRLTDALKFTSNDGIVSWLPMYHDMGLIACLWLPLWNNAPSTQFAAMDWLLDPGMLFRLMSKYAATFSWLPNFSFSYLAAHKDRVGEGVDLDHVRAWINCSEPVRERSFRAFIKAFAGCGVRSEQCQASYAMAENVFAISQTQLDISPKTISRSRVGGIAINQSYAAYEVMDDVYVSSGRVMEGTEVRIRGIDSRLCKDRALGGIEIRGESLFSGYWGDNGFSKETVATDHWYATGDLGFTDSGDLYVIGRLKDVIIVGGQNIYPEDVEMLVNSVNGVHPGRVVAFGLEDSKEGTQSLAVVAEMREKFSFDQAKDIEREIHRVIFSSLGIVARHVRIVSERWVVKSTAGKISRRETRERFIQESGV